MNTLTQIGPARAVHVDRISTGIVETSFRIVDQAFGTQFLLSHPVYALDVGVALILHGVPAISFWTRHRALRRVRLLLIASRTIVKQLVGEPLILIKR